MDESDLEKTINGRDEVRGSEHVSQCNKRADYFLAFALHDDYWANHITLISFQDNKEHLTNEMMSLSCPSISTSGKLNADHAFGAEKNSL